MAIRLTKEDGDIGLDFELCCFCQTPTPFWTNIARRKSGEQVACCKKCALHRLVGEVPTKMEWCTMEEVEAKVSNVPRAPVRV